MNGVERVKRGSEVRVGQKNGAPVETGTPYAHEFVAFRLLAIELADSNALAVLVNVTEVADADGLSDVGAGGHS